MKKLLYSIIFLFAVNTSFATHNKAGDITYTHISGFTYKITINTFTSTGGSVTDRCSLIVYFGDGDSATAPRVNGFPSDCPTADGVVITSCTGYIKSNIYETTHTYPGNGSFMITMEDPNRAGGICNVPDSDNTSFFLQAELIISAFVGPNTGPVYNQVPVVCAAIGNIANYNPLAIDADGDSLFYELIPAMASGAFVSGYAYPTSSSSFSIDYQTANVIWDAPTMICYYVFDIRITEWRNIAGTYYRTGTTMQEVWCQSSTTIGISNEEAQNVSVNVSPNPSTDNVNISITNPLNKDLSVQIINSLGQIMGNYDLHENTGKTISIENLKPGMYFYQINNPGKTIINGKFVVLSASVK